MPGTYTSYLAIKREIHQAISNIQEALVDQELHKNINYKILASKQIFVRWQVTFFTLNFLIN